MIETILFTNEKVISIIKSFWSLNMRKDCEWKYFHYHLLAFGKVVGHSTPCGTLYHRSRKKACYPEGEWGKEEEEEKKT